MEGDGEEDTSPVPLACFAPAPSLSFVQKAAAAAPKDLPPRARVPLEAPCSCPRSGDRPHGVPRCARLARWAQRCDAQQRKAPRWNCCSTGGGGSGAEDYNQLLEQSWNEQARLERSRRQVRLDVERTCPALEFFQNDGKRMLTNVLDAWVVYDEEVGCGGTTLDEAEGWGPVGYVQGMSYIAMNLLWHAGCEVQTFWLFVGLMHGYGLRCMFEPPDMSGLQARVFTVQQLLQYVMPSLSSHLAEHLQNSLGLIITDWLLTLFASSVALSPLAELWDKFFTAGYSVVYRLILARLRCLQQWLMAETDFSSLTFLIRSAHVNFDRIDGRLVARLKAPSNGAGAVAGAVCASNGGETERHPRRWRHRIKSAFGIGSTSGAPAVDASDSNGASAGLCGQSGARPAGVDEADGGAVVPESSAGPPAGGWTCAHCNSSEECESWLALVTELSEAEQVPVDLIRHFECIFGGPTLPEIQRIALPACERACEEQYSAGGAGAGAGSGMARTGSSNGVRDTTGCRSEDVEISSLRLENASLRAANAELRAGCAAAAQMFREASADGSQEDAFRSALRLLEGLSAETAPMTTLPAPTAPAGDRDRQDDSAAAADTAPMTTLPAPVAPAADSANSVDEGACALNGAAANESLT